LAKGSEFFYCFSKRLHKFLNDKGIPPICEGLSKRKQSHFWQYLNDDSFDEAFEEYKSIYGLNKNSFKNRKYLYANDLGDFNKYRCELMVLNDMSILKHSNRLTEGQIQELGKILNIKGKATLKKRIKIFCENGFLVEHEGFYEIPLYSVL
jgi:hypothetical protein